MYRSLFGSVPLFVASLSAIAMVLASPFPLSVLAQALL
jgi:hypothetical protein